MQKIQTSQSMPRLEAFAMGCKRVLLITSSFIFSSGFSLSLLHLLYFVFSFLRSAHDGTALAQHKTAQSVCCAKSGHTSGDGVGSLGLNTFANIASMPTHLARGRRNESTLVEKDALGLGGREEAGNLR